MEAGNGKCITLGLLVFWDLFIVPYSECEKLFNYMAGEHGLSPETS
jgi:hypothetical protein